MAGSDSFRRAHGRPTRGLGLGPRSTLFEGRFGRIFRALPPAEFGRDEQETGVNLAALAEALVNRAPDPLEDKIDNEESGIPAAYTYLGQFIDHDLTFDPASSLQRQNDPDALVDFRTPAFDLDSLFARGPDDQPYLYGNAGDLVVGRPLRGQAAGQEIERARDLARIPPRNRAVIGDPRNDENIVVSQLQGLFIRFYNRLLRDSASGDIDLVQREVRYHYQWLVTADFLRKIVDAAVLADVLPHIASGSDVCKDKPKVTLYQPRNSPFMPLEFSAAAYRFGHSMVRPGYRLNDDDGTLLPVFRPGEQQRSLMGFREFPSGWAIDWSRFVHFRDLPADGKGRMQLAYRIDASLVTPLGALPDPVVPEDDPIRSLAHRNLVRGWRMRLPSGQTIARALGVDVLTTELKIGKAEDDGADLRPIESVAKIFVQECPLWVYILAEAAYTMRKTGTHLPVSTKEGTRQVGTPQLGQVGGRIVAETFAGIMLGDHNSFWRVDPKWKPSVTEDGKFGLREFIEYALGDG